MPSTPPNDAIQVGLQLLDQRAWAIQFRDFERAASLGRELVDASDDPAWRCRGWAHVAMARIRGAGAVLDTHPVTQALAAASQAQDPLLDALCRDLRAMVLRRENRHAEALALLEPNLAMDETRRGGYASYCSANLAGQLCRLLGDVDRAQQLRYRALGLAQVLDDPALVANACANLGGLHTDLLSLDEALVLSEQAVAAADAAGLQGSTVWLTSTFNLVTAHLLRKEAAAALPVARRMQAFHDSVPLLKQGRYEVLWATAALASGLSAETRQWLDRARERWPRDDDVIIEWHLADAMLANHECQYEQARAACDRGRILTQSGGDEVLPIDLLQLYDAGVLACEKLGDFQAALAYKHLAFVQYDLVAGSSARARRVTAEIQHALELAERAREESSRRRQAAEAEQQRLAGLNAALQEASAARTRFLAAASHDLRQPLNALGLQTSNLAAKLQGSPHAQSVAHMEQAVAALAGMFDSLLDLSHIEAGVVQAVFQPVAVASLLAQLLQEHQAEADQRGLRLTLRVPAAALRLQVHSDPLLLGRVVRNLLSNALKYTRRGGVLVALRRRGGAGAGATSAWRVQVIDTGIGIAGDELGRVFDAFFQVAPPDGARPQGLGLGLSIVQRLSDLLGHPLHVSSTLGRGSRFGIDLQAWGAAAGAAQEQPATDAGKPARQTLVGLRVAVAEDDDIARQTLVQLLQDWGCQVLAAASADALLEHLAAQPAWLPEALITDYRMPGALDGLGLLAVWCERWGAAGTALVLTGETYAPLLAAAGVQSLRKPLSAPALKAWLLALLPPGPERPPQGV